MNCRLTRLALFSSPWLLFACNVSAAAEDGDVASRPATVRDFGAAGDGLADDTLAIQRAAEAGRGEVRLPPGRYRITRPIVIDLDASGPVAVAAEGTARLIMAGPGPAIRLVGTHRGTADPGSVKPEVWERQRMPTVDGLAIVGEHPEADGIEATGTVQLTITRCHVRGVRHAIRLVERNRNVIVANCHLYENRGVGLYLDDVNLHQINVTGCHISYNDAGGIVVRAGNVRNLHVAGCDLEGNMDADGPPTANILIDAAGGEAGTAEVAITGCTIQHTHDAPDSANIRFLGLDARGRNWGHLTIQGNVLSDVQVNVDIGHARGVNVTGNTFWKGVQHNLRVVESSNVVIGPNTMDRNPQYQDEEAANDGVLLRGCRDSTITGLHIRGVRRAPAGLVLDDCERVNVTGCTILDCDHAGILLRNVSRSRVSDCLIANDPSPAAGWEPVVVEGGEGNQIGEY